MTSRGSQLAVTIVSFIVLLLYTIGCAAPYWVVVKNLSHVGLWQICGTDNCYSMGDDVGSDLKATRAFGILSILFAFFAFVLFAANYFGKYSKKQHASILFIIAAFCAMIEFSIWYDKGGKHFSDNLGIAFWMVVIAWPIGLLVGLFSLRNDGYLPI